MKLWLAVVVHSKKQLNQQGGKAVAEEQQPTVNLLTMEITVKAPKKQASGSLGVFYLALEHFRHLCRARDVLSESESHALSTWLATQLGIRRPLDVVEATLLELLTCMDADMSQDLATVIKTEARHMLVHQMDLTSSNSDGFQDTQPLTASQKKRAAKKATAAADKAYDKSTLPLQEPNSACCWYHTNGLECPKKFLDAKGTCKYEHLHPFCGMPLAAGGFCKENHKATEHP